MPDILDPMDIYDRGLRNLSCLQGAERFVFMLQDFDNLMEMEGWDHFFLYDHHFIWYSEMKDWLAAIGDKASLTLLEDYEGHLKKRGVPLCSTEIRKFLNTQDDAYLRTCPDWSGEYCKLREDRWAKAIVYFEGQGLRLQSAELDAAEDNRATGS